MRSFGSFFARGKLRLGVLLALISGCGDAAYWDERSRSVSETIVVALVAALALVASVKSAARILRRAERPSPVVFSWVLFIPCALLSGYVLRGAAHADVLFRRDLPLLLAGVAPGLWTALTHCERRPRDFTRALPIILWLVYASSHATRAASLLPALPKAPVAVLRSGIPLGVALMEDGTVWEWPNGPAAPRHVAQIAGAVDVTSTIDARCALLKGGEVECWDGPTVLRIQRFSGAVKIVAGRERICALLGSGRVACMQIVAGRERSCALSEGEQVPCRQADVAEVDDAVSIAVGEHQTCAARRDGSVRCWGKTEGSPEGLTDVTEIAAGAFHVCARRRDGKVLCWGANTVGQVGDGTYRSASTPGAVRDVAGAVEIASGAYHTCARIEDGAVFCWGSTGGGVLGIDRARLAEERSSPLPVRYPIPNAALSVVAGPGYTCARTQSDLYCSGWNGYNSLRTGVGDRCGGDPFHITTCTTRPSPVSFWE